MHKQNCEGGGGDNDDEMMMMLMMMMMMVMVMVMMAMMMVMVMMTMMLGNGVLPPRLGPSGQEFPISWQIGSQKRNRGGWKCNIFVSSPEGGLSSQQSELLKAFEGKQTIQRENDGPKQKTKRGGNRKQTNE